MGIERMNIMQSNGNSIIVCNDKVIMNGKEIDLPKKLRQSLKKGNSCVSQCDNKLVINGYVYKNEKFKFNILEFIIQLFS